MNNKKSDIRIALIEEMWEARRVLRKMDAEVKKGGEAFLWNAGYRAGLRKRYDALSYVHTLLLIEERF